MTTLQKFLIQVAVGTAAIVAVTTTAWNGTLTSAAAYTTMSALLVALSLTGIWTLASTSPNADALPHLLLGVELLAAVVVLANHHVFTSDQLQAIIGMVVVGGSITGGAVAGQATYAAALEKLAATEHGRPGPVLDHPPAPLSESVPAPH